MNSNFSEQILADKLSKLNSTQQCIESILFFVFVSLNLMYVVFLLIRDFRIEPGILFHLSYGSWALLCYLFLGVAEWMCSANSLHCLAELARMFFGFGLPAVTLRCTVGCIWLCIKKWYNNYPMVSISVTASNPNPCFSSLEAFPWLYMIYVLMNWNWTAIYVENLYPFWWHLW